MTGNIYGQLLTPSASLSSQSVRSKTVSKATENVSTKFAQLNVVQYNIENPANNALARQRSVGDSVQVTSFEPSADELQIYSKTHYGFVAQELQEIYPDLVYENAQGELGINYIEMIPLLVQSLQELSAEVSALRSEKAQTRGAMLQSSDYTSFDLSEDMVAELFQNIPNPFTVNTEIRYRIPKDAQVAILHIYDMNGKEIDEISLSQKGEGVYLLKAGRLVPGMYLYSLIIDGKLIDVKRMVLTK